jgi:serine/threonine protein kinase/tetratricopeptide (TPR) repeat protein
MSEADSALGSGERVANYQILGKLGAGGMGVVYKALDLKLQRTVALKFLPPELNASERDKERFLREAQTASSLDHTHIGVIHGIEETVDGRAFIVMAYYDGESLAQKIRGGPLAFRDAVDMAIQIGEGLAEAHAHHIVHRDVKPSNVMITTQGTAKIVDFGLARIVMTPTMTQTGGTTGTVGYMSPEQVLGRGVDQRADIWAFGVILAEMLLGKNPFHRDSMPSIIVAILNEPPQAMDGVPAELQQIVYRALAKDVANRYQTCAEILADLRAIRSRLPEPAAEPDPSAATRSVRPADFQKYLEQASNSAWGPAPRKRSAMQWVLLAGAVLLVAAAGLSFVPSVRERFAGSLAASGQKHIAVLPFDNFGNNPANEALAEGLMDSLAGKLSNLDVGQQSLWVVPASEVRRRKVNDPEGALREFGATMVVKGSIQRDGQDVHLTVNLIDTKDMRQIGSASIEDRAGDLYTLQDEAVSQLARLMHITVTAEMLRNTGGSVTPAAYEDYLKALGYMQRYDKPGNLDLAIETLQNAVKTDPRFALGYAQLGEAYRAKYELDRNPKWIEEASANCQKAVQFNDRLPAVYVTLGRLHDVSGEYDLALQEFNRALELNPSDPDALAGTGRAYENAGRIADAEAAYKKAAALRPDSWEGYNRLGNFLDRHQKYQEAIAAYQQANDLTPDNAEVYMNIGNTYLDMGDPKMVPAAEQALKKSVALSPSYAAYTNLGSLYLTEKRYSDSAAVTEKALQINGSDFRVWENLASAYDWLQQKDRAALARETETKLAEESSRTRPRDAQVQSALANLYARKKLREKTLVRIQAALALDPNDPRVLMDVGQAYDELGDRRVAIEYTEKALEKGFSLEDLKSIWDLQSLTSDPNFRPTVKK